MVHLSHAHSEFIWASLIGIIGALVTVAFRQGIGWVEFIVTGHSGGGSLVSLARSLSWPMRIVIPTIGGVIAGFFLVWSNRFGNSAASDYMEAISILDGKLSVRQSLLRSFSSMWTIASGGSIGREGSMVQLSAMCASLVGRISRFDPARLKLLVACGAAAGITSAYNTPLAGAFFVMEIVLGSIAMASVGPIVVAAVVANVTMRALPGYRPTYEVPTFPAIPGTEVWLFISLGIIAGLIAPVFLYLLETAKNAFKRTALPLPLRLGLGGLCLGIISIQVPAVWGNGYSVVNSLLHDNWTSYAVILILAAKIVATAMTTGSGAVGGVFTPTLFVGAALGWLFGTQAQMAFPHLTSTPPAFAIVGMGAFLAGAANAPLTAILMIFEMTLSYQVVLPLMLACVISNLLSRTSSERSMYAVTLKRAALEKERERVRNMQMRDLVKPAETVLSESATLHELAVMFQQYSVKYIYIINVQGMYQGVVAAQDITAAMMATDASRPALAQALLRRAHLQVLTMDMSLEESMTKFMLHQGERLPIIESLDHPVLTGVVFKTSVLDAYTRLSQS